MPGLSAVRYVLALAAFLVGAGLLFNSPGVQAQQGPAEGAEQGVPNGHYVPRHPSRDVGFYSLRLSDIWGPAKMPPAPKDFGPHFDFPPEPLNGAPLHDPYPN
jgi:hypothetical protein